MARRPSSDPTCYKDTKLNALCSKQLTFLTTVLTYIGIVLYTIANNAVLLVTNLYITEYLILLWKWNYLLIFFSNTDYWNAEQPRQNWHHESSWRYINQSLLPFINSSCTLNECKVQECHLVRMKRSSNCIDCVEMWKHCQKLKCMDARQPINIRTSAGSDVKLNHFIAWMETQWQTNSDAITVGG